MKKIYILSIIVLIIFSAGCAKFLDVNRDPNNTSESTVELVFPAGVENAASVFGGYWLNLGEIWSQHWTSAANAPQYQAEDSYNVTAGDYAYDLRGWEYLYTRALTDFQWVKETAKEDSNWTFYLMAETMQCYTYHVLADFFDQIPLSNALQEVPATFDTGEQVYDTLIARLDVALSKDLDGINSTDPEQSDIVFGGDMDDWTAFANTLKLKIFLRQRFVRPGVAQAGIQEMYANGVSFLNKDATMGEENFQAGIIGQENYMYELEFRTGNINMKASRTLLDFLVGKGFDPREDYLFEPGTSLHNGMYQGDFRNVYSNIEDKNLLSSPLITADQPVYFISEAESYFLQAEACMLGWGTGNDQSLYEAGIDAHFMRLGATEPGSDIYNEYAIYPNGTDEENLEAIIFQKWISMANTQGMEAFFEHNRTGYPRESLLEPGDEDFPDELVDGEFTVSVTGVLTPPVKYPKRLLFPSSEQSTNTNVPPIESLNVPVWWDVRNYQDIYTK